MSNVGITTVDSFGCVPLRCFFPFGWIVTPQGADRMTVERVTRFYLGEFQTTLTKGGKYINELNPEEEKALVRCVVNCIIYGSRTGFGKLGDTHLLYDGCSSFCANTGGSYCGGIGAVFV